MAGLSTGTTITTTQANELCIGCIAFSTNSSTDSPTNSFTEVTERASGAPGLTVLERIVSATGTYGTDVSWNTSVPVSYGLCGAIATFKRNENDAYISISTSSASAAAPSIVENHGSSIAIGSTTASCASPGVSAQGAAQSSISLSSASATTLTISENHESFIVIDTNNVSCIMPNVNVQAASQTSISVSTATATSFSVTVSVRKVINILTTSTATANLLSVTENHGSSVQIGTKTANATTPSITSAISFSSPVFTSTANTLALTANGIATVNLNTMVASASSVDSSAQGGTSAVARRIIISCG